MRAALNSQPSAPAVSGHREEQSRNTPSGIILVIDDDKDWLAECSFMLETLGLRSIVTSSHEAALAHAANPEISLVIIDYSMPSSDGLTMIHQLSAIAAEGGRQMQFIMATGHASMDIAIGAMRASAADFLQKPVSPDDLKRALQRVNGLNDAASARTALLSKISSLSTELQRLTVLIDDKPASDSAGSAAQSEPEAVSAEFIRALLRNEAKRRKLGGGVLFGDPAWDLLLDLLLAKLEGRTVSVSSACIASGAPTTTALRLINRLIEENILYREQDARDGRRNFLGIHADIEQALTSYLIEQMKL
ncbi:MAG: response regulator [Sphingobium sp.]|nr:response regulator [Sphingobium sp.]